MPLASAKASAIFKASERRTVISNIRIALANLRVPTTPDESVRLATSAVADARRKGAAVVCFPECFIPGYRWPGQEAPSPDPAFLERAWAAVADAAGRAGVAVILGTERVTDRGLQITVCVFNPDGTIAGWQDKCVLHPSEESIYPAVGTERRLFSIGPLTFGVAICVEGFRHPETVRAAVRRGAQVVFHPHVVVRRTRKLSPDDVCRSRQHFPREGHALPRGGEYVLLRIGELRQRGRRHDVRGRISGRHAAVLSAVRRGRPPRDGSEPQHSHRIVRLTVPCLTYVARLRQDGHYRE